MNIRYRIERKIRKTAKFILLMLLGLAGATGIGYFFQWRKFPDTNIVIVYIFSVLLTARIVTGYIYGVTMSIAATLTFNYFFTAPYFTLNVYDPAYFVTFVIMTVTAALTSTLTSRARKNEQEARKKEKVTNSLYHLTHRLTNAADFEMIQRVLVEEAGKALECPAACICFDQNGQPMDYYLVQNGDTQTIRKISENGEKRYFSDIVFAKNTVSLEGKFSDWPIRGKDKIFGVLRLPKELAVGAAEEYRMLLKTMLENTALAMERVWSVQESNRSKEEIAQERYRGNLLRAISHDIRTPLTGIMGSSELLENRLKDDKEGTKLVEDIYQDADWLLSMVENILNLTRLQDGRLVLHKEAEAVEEVVESAVFHIMKRYPGREIMVKIPEKLVIVQMDARLIEQVLVNLLDNAVKHTDAGKEICLLAEIPEKGKQIVFRVQDRGSGIAEKDLPYLFQIFYTSNRKNMDSKRGVGLGLAICESIVKMHGGTITATNRQDGEGAEFMFELPLEEKYGEQKHTDSGD